MTPLTPTPLARLGIASPRWVFNLAVLYSLGAILLWIAAARPPADPGWRVFLVVLGALVLVLSESTRRAQSVVLELTETELREAGGRTIARLSDVVAVERGMMAFKPSNGFLLRLSQPAPRAWVPGIWWRFGRRVGVGGVLPAGAARFMAEMIAARIARPDDPDWHP